MEITPLDHDAWLRQWDRELYGLTVSYAVPSTPRVASMLLRPPVRYLGVLPNVDGPEDRVERAPLGFIDEAPGLAGELGWATVDVLDARVGPLPDDPRQLADYDDPTPRRLGWLERFCTTWRTRLVILRADLVSRNAGRLLGGLLAERGGPLVVVAPEGWDGHWSLIETLQLGRDLSDGGVLRDVDVIGGGGRERLLEWRPLVDVDGLHILSEARLFREEELEWDDVEDLRDALDEFHDRYAGLGHKVTTFDQIFDETEPRDAHVVLRDAEQELVDISETIRPGEVYHVEVSVGVGPGAATIVDLEHPLTELLPDAQGGRWAEVGITPIDVEVVGSTTQQLWIPPTGPGPPALFTIIPRGDGLVAFRVTIYVDKWAIRSYRVVARTNDDEELVARHAAALYVGVDLARQLEWAVRQEFRNSDPIDTLDLPKRPAAASLVVNLMDGEPLITSNSPGRFATSANADLGRLGQQLRVALWELETNPVTGYRYQGGGVDPTHMDDQIVALAKVGWDAALWILPHPEDREAFRSATDADVIQVVETETRRTPMPWACIYDEEVDEDVPPAVCHALDRHPAGQPLPPCGSSPDCRLQPGVEARSVVCPRNFWGFRAVVDQSLGGLSKNGRAYLTPHSGLIAGPAPEPRVVTPNAKPIVALNRSIDNNDDHAREVRDVLNTLPRFQSAQIAPIEGDVPVRHALRDTDAAFVYLASTCS